jgi:hypothetical protein
MQRRIDLTALTPCAEFAREDAEDDTLLHEMIEAGRSYVSRFEWCREVVECYVGDIAIAGVVAVLLLKIEPAHKNVDEWLWVVIGDLPPAYLVTDAAPNPAAALEVYVGEMERWVAAVEAGEPSDDLIPVHTSSGGEALEPTPEVADDLKRRLRFLDDEVLRYHAEDLEVSDA